MLHRTNPFPQFLEFHMLISLLPSGTFYLKAFDMHKFSKSTSNFNQINRTRMKGIGNCSRETVNRETQIISEDTK